MLLEELYIRSPNQANKMEEILYEYLILNKKAVVPGLGIFKIQRNAAYLDFSKKQFVAPSYHIVFTQGAFEADKAFYSFFAKKQQTDEAEAIKRFSDFSHNLVAQLNEKGDAELQGTGRLHKNETGILQFTQSEKIDSFFTNLSVETTIPKNSLSETVAAETYTKKNELLKLETEETKALSHKKDYWWVYATILAVGAIAAIFFYYNQNGSLR